MATPKSVTPDVSASGMKPGDAAVDVMPKMGGGYTLSPLPTGGRRRRSTKGARRSRRRGGAEEMVEGARRRKTAGRRSRRRGGAEVMPASVEGARRRRKH
jgi:hypothetical protein